MNESVKILNALIKVHAAALGPQIAVALARKTTGLRVADNGDVLGVEGDPEKALKQAIGVFGRFAPEISKVIIAALSRDYPEMKDDR